MPEVMYPDPLDSCRLRCAIQFPVQGTVVEVENAIPWLDLIEGRDVALHFVIEECGHGNLSDAVVGLGRAWGIFPRFPVVSLADPHHLGGQNISRSQRQALPHPEPTPVHDLERHSEAGLRDLLQGGVKLGGCPEVHFASLFLPHEAGRQAGILPQAIVHHRIVENGRQTAVDGAEI